MPELPEVETIARTLAPHLAGRRVRSVDVVQPRLRAPLAPDFGPAVAGRRVVRIARYGKALVLDVGDGEAVLAQLGMTGRLTLRSATEPPRPHDHVRFVLDDGRRLVFNDVRRFGWLRLVQVDAIGGLLGGGVDPILGAFTPDALFAATRRRRVSAKSLLMDQRVVLGIGNIYASEILFHAGVRPRRRAARLTRAQCMRIVEATAQVLADAITCGGSTISDYRDGFDRVGTYQHRHHVYGRRGHACRSCGTAVAACRVVGRSTFYCPRCQC